MSPTNALREALERIAALQARWQAPTSSEDTADSNAKWAAVGSEAHGIAVEALAAVPAEPEAWEWRAGYSAWGTAPCATEGQAVEACEWFRGHAPEWIERRRRGIAPGSWERVDPEPRPQDG